MTDAVDSSGSGRQGASDSNPSAERARGYAEGYEAVFKQASIGMVKTDLHGHHLMVNDRYCEITGYSRDEILGKSFLNLTHPDDIAKNKSLFHDLLARKIPRYEIEKRYIRKNGSICWVQVSVAMELDGNHQPRSVIAGVQDITEAKRTEATLRFLVNLDAATQQVSDPQQMMALVAQRLGEHLGVNRCAYAEVEADQDQCSITGDYTFDVPSSVGRYRFSDFGSDIVQRMRANQPFIIEDIEANPRAGANLSAYRQAQIRAIICVPLHKAGVLVAAMAVHQTSPRHWTAGEIELMQMVVGRCWESLERTRASRSLHESERQMRFIMDAMPQKIFTSKATGETLYYNSAWPAFTGIAPAELQDWGWVKIIHPDDLEQNLRVWRSALENVEPFYFEHRFRTTDGTYRWHRSQAFPMHSEHGDLLMWVGCCTDIHEAKMTELALKETLISERREAALLARLAAASQSIHAVLSPDDIAQMLTEETRSLIGAHQAVVSLSTNRNWAQAITAVSLSDKYAIYRSYNEKADGSGIYAEVCRTNRSMRMTQAELEQHPAWRGFGTEHHRHPPMNGWLAVPLVGHGGKNLGLIQASDKYNGDFTEEDESVLTQLAMIASVGIENALLYDSLREQDQRKDEFLAMLAHELRNPLAPIRTGLELLNRAADPNHEKTGRIRQIMDRQLTHMVRLVDDLLDVSRVSRGKVELKRARVAIADVVESALDASRPLMEASQHELLVSLPEQPLYVDGDFTRLSQVVNNLLNNAAKYTLEGGSVSLCVREENGHVVVQVSDTGIGISDEMLSKIFELFSQAEPGIGRAQGGLGIGLSLVQKLVELHGGQVWAESAGSGKGSTFIVKLPLASAPAEPKPAPTAVIEPAVAAAISRRILVVDDNLEAAETLSMLLEMLGHQTGLAHSGEAALELVKDFRPELIFLDIGLPRMSGYEVAKQLRKMEELASLKLVALTGWGGQEDRQRAKEAGFDHHLTKPIDITDLSHIFAELEEADRGKS